MSVAIQRKTPGVYIREISAFPPSVVGVETAIPAFIGYTEKALLNGTDVTLQPIKITSLADYEQIFGGAYPPDFGVVEKEAAEDAVKNAAEAVAKATDDAKAKARAEEEAAAEAAAPPYITLGDKAYVFNQGKRLFYLYNSLRLFYANGGGTCYIVSAGDYATGVEEKPLADGVAAIRDQVGPTMLVIPDAILLTKPAYGNIVTAVLDQCGKLLDRVAILDVYGVDSFAPTEGVQNALDHIVTEFRSAVGTENLSYGMAYFPALHTSVVRASDMSLASFKLGDPSTLDKLKGALMAEVDRLYLPPPPSPDVPKKVTDLRAEIGKLVARPAAPAKLAEADASNADKKKAWAADWNAFNEWPKGIDILTKELVTHLPALKDVFALMADKLNLLPPSGAMAGIYTKIDSTRGVWNAPANVSLTSVVGPNFKVTAAMQEDLNVPLNGKAINAIRDFVGQGTLVWGARTLDGNSNDYRYIQVRRTLVYVEQSIKAALNPFVFAANDAQTWANVTAMISSFLTSLWTRGGLMGAKASEAFTVQCGLGSTMTGQDVLEGYMRVQVTLQMIRPAEFIELTFTQKMQGVG